MNTFFLKEPYKLLVVCIAGVFLFCIASCSQEEKPVKATDQNAASKKIEPAKNTAKNESKKENGKEKNQKDQLAKEYSYDATGKPDPFEPLIAAIAATKQSQSPIPQQQKIDKPLTPLQKLDLSDLFLVAIVDTDNSSTALIEDNARNGYIVREGMLIGKNDGTIKKILKNSMIVEEKIADSTGTIETKISTLTIYKKE